MNNIFGFGGMPAFGFGAGIVITILLVWTLYWKYHAIWHAVKHDRKWWFLALLVINTLGILEILYLYVFSKKSKAVK